MRPVGGAENDRIGRLGEIEFFRLCELAKLSCSKVEPDRTGKDFIVEFPPLALAMGQSFERRDAPRQFAVQVKTIKAQTRSATLTLSVAERLARDLWPTLVCAAASGAWRRDTHHRASNLQQCDSYPDRPGVRPPPYAWPLSTSQPATDLPSARKQLPTKRPAGGA